MQRSSGPKGKRQTQSDVTKLIGIYLKNRLNFLGVGAAERQSTSAFCDFLYKLSSNTKSKEFSSGWASESGNLLRSNLASKQAKRVSFLVPQHQILKMIVLKPILFAVAITASADLKTLCGSLCAANV